MTTRGGRRGDGGTSAVVALLSFALILAAAHGPDPADAQPRSPAAINLQAQCVAAVGSGAPRYAVTVDGQHFNPATAVLVTFDSARGGRPETSSAQADGFGRFRTIITPTGRAPGRYQVRADDLKQREATADVELPAPCPPIPPKAPPVIALEPPIGPPGFVTSAVGTGFPPGAPVTLSWSQGINASPSPPVVADATGGFRAPVLVFHRDLLGPRKLKATPAGGGSFSPDPEADFLVVAPSAQPPDFALRR